MSQTVEAIYERGAFRPLRPLSLAEGQQVVLSFEPVVLSPAEVEQQLVEWRSVYAGLSDDDIEDVERVVLNRIDFMPPSED